jgi:hypothetical protein
MKSEVDAAIVYKYKLEFVCSAILRLFTVAAATPQAIFIRIRRNGEYN